MEKSYPFPIRFAQPLPPEQKRAVLASAKTRRWLEGLAASHEVRGVTIDRVYFFGGKVGFVVAQADARLPDGTAVPGIALVRGDALAVLPVLVAPDGAKWTVLVRQSRVPVGEAAYEEIPAGMLDEHGAFVSKALEELEEEVGADLGIGAEDLRLLETVHPSPGGSDETVRVFVAEKPVTAELLRALRGRRTGRADENEAITVDVVPLDDLACRATTDMKARVAYYSYHARLGIVPRPTVRAEADAEAEPRPRGP